MLFGVFFPLPGGLQTDDLAIRPDRESVRSFLFFFVAMHLGMTVTAEQLEVVPVQRDLRMVDRHRIYLDLVMDDDARTIDAETKTALA